MGCVFGFVRVPAMWVSSAFLRCVSPASSIDGNVGLFEYISLPILSNVEPKLQCHSPVYNNESSVMLKISNNGIDFTSDEIWYKFAQPPVTGSVSTTVGSTSGGTVVTVSGSNSGDYMAEIRRDLFFAGMPAIWRLYMSVK